MKLLLIHGWGLAPSFWSPMIRHLQDFECNAVDLGYFGAPSSMPAPCSDTILVGHSFGFMHGMLASNTWSASIAINSFARFADDCVPARVLDKMSRRFQSDPTETLQDFHKLIGCQNPPSGELQTERLARDLAQLQHTDLTDQVTAQTSPLLVLSSANDLLVPHSVSENLAGAKGEIHIHESGGHLLPQNDPDWCADIIRMFLKRCEAA